MSTKMEYEFLNVESIPGYLAGRKGISDVIDAADLAEINEVGDGNLNLVFIVKDRSGRGIVLKQALPYVRLVGPSWPMSPDRARIEYEATLAYSKVAPELVPIVYFYDAARYIIAMEDLSDHEVWRTALNRGEFHRGSASAVGEYIAKSSFATSIFGLGGEMHKQGLAHAINPEICLITEDLVFTEPYFPNGRNSVLPENEADAQAIIDDEFLKLEVGKLKYDFMTNSEALIHGDLHSGSIMVKANEDGKSVSTRAFDAEFAFYGPIAFDIGAVIANFYIAMARSTALDRTDHREFLRTLPEEVWVSFESNFKALWPTRVDKRVFNDEFLADLLAKWKRDSLGFAAAKMIRRIVGLAKTSDIETLEPALRIGAARGVLWAAQMIIRERDKDTDLNHITRNVLAVLAENRTRVGV